ncbi:MAG TPA: GDP-mannose 4,6-dehydratase [Mycobacteriales bacterium]|nr:GDP-mannose 4,6-dehydratase [Mycobacteriales bacterium]
MVRSALITGVGGQDGVHLARFLIAQGYQVVGTVRSGHPDQLRLAAYLDGVDVVEADVRDAAAMRRLIYEARPDEVYNLAALSSVGSSWVDEREVAEVNGVAVGRLLEVLLRYRDECGSAPRFFQASSAEIFGPAQAHPQTERTPRQPLSPYGLAKLTAHETATRFRDRYGLHVSNGILFNHESPLRHPRFVIRKISQAAAALATGGSADLALGTLEIRRDWGAAADVVRAMWLMLQQDVPDDYVIATGVSTSLRQLAEIAFAVAGFDDPWRFVREDPAIERPMDPPQLWGDATHAREILGWVPGRTLTDVMKEMVEADIERLRRGVAESPDLLSGRT